MAILPIRHRLSGRPYSRQPLSELTKSFHKSKCPYALQPVSDVVNSDAQGQTRKIPKIIHQTSKSRCITPEFKRIIQKWRDKFPDYQYYFHDDDAVDRLLNQDWPMFPHLSIVSKCLQSGAAKADLWRYVVMYEYGGIYTDIDTIPNALNASLITEEHDSFFVIEQYHLLSQYFMAVSPRHPVMFYAIHDALSNILNAKDANAWDAALVTGPHALHHGFQKFMKDVGQDIPKPALGPISEGDYIGTNQRVVTAVGIPQNENEYVIRERIRRGNKQKEYQKMNMTHFSTLKFQPLGKTCYTLLMEMETERLNRTNQ